MQPSNWGSIPQQAIETWKQAQETHRHLNTILFQIRNIAFVFAGAVLGVVGAIFRLQPKTDVPQDTNLLLGAPDSLGLVLILAAIPLYALYLLDRYYYHVLLIATVTFARTIEAEFPALAMSSKLRELNRLQPFPLSWASKGRAKITLFYGLLLGTFVGVGVTGLSGTLLGLLSGAAVLAFLALVDQASSGRIE